MEARTSPAKHEFFCAVNQTTFRQLHNGRFPPKLVAKHMLVSHRRILKNIFEIFTFGVICPQNLKSKIGQTGTSLRAGYRMHCREILFTPRCSRRATELPRSGQLFSTTYDCGASKLPSFRILAYFPPYKTLKMYLLVTSLQPRDYIAEWLQFFRVIVEGLQGCLPAPEISCDFW